MNKRYSKKSVWLSLLFFIVFVAVFLLFFLNERTKKAALKNGSGIRAVATIVAVGFKNFDYEYEANGKVFKQKRSKFMPDMETGKKFIIFYDAHSPSYHACDFSPLIMDTLHELNARKQ